MKYVSDLQYSRVLLFAELVTGMVLVFSFGFLILDGLLMHFVNMLLLGAECGGFLVACLRLGKLLFVVYHEWCFAFFKPNVDVFLTLISCGGCLPFFSLALLACFLIGGLLLSLGSLADGLFQDEFAHFGELTLPGYHLELCQLLQGIAYGADRQPCFKRKAANR